MLGTSWFPGGELNFAENLLLHLPENEAIISIQEGQSTRRFSRKKSSEILKHWQQPWDCLESDPEISLQPRL